MRRWLMEPGRAVRIIRWLMAGALACWALSIALLAAAKDPTRHVAGDWTPPRWLLQGMRGVETGLGAAAVIVCIALAAISLAALAAVIVKKRRER